MIGAGHTLQQISGYTIRQAELLLKAHVDNKKLEWRGLFALQRVAFHADAKGVKEYLKGYELEDD